MTPLWVLKSNWEILESAVFGTLGFTRIKSGFLWIVSGVAPLVTLLKSPGIKTYFPAMFLA